MAELPGLAAPARPLQQHTGFSVAHYLTDIHTWSAVFGPGLKSGLGPWWPAVLAAALVGPLLCLWGGDSRDGCSDWSRWRRWRRI